MVPAPYTPVPMNAKISTYMAGVHQRFGSSPLSNLDLWYDCKHLNDERTTNAVVWGLVTSHPKGEEACLMCKDGDGMPLFLALRTDMKPSTIRLIIECCPQTVSVLDKKGLSSMQIAVKYTSWVGVVRCIHDAHPSSTRSLTDDGLFPLHVAIETGRCDQIIMALARLDPLVIRARNVVGKENSVAAGSSALTIAIANKCSADVIRTLAGICPISLLFINMSSEAALSVAISMDSPLDVMEVLLAVAVDDCRAALTTQNKEQASPLEQAIALRRSPSIISILLEATVRASFHLHKHISFRASLANLSDNDFFKKSGFDFSSKNDAFCATTICYKGGEKILTQSINSQKNSQRILENCLSMISMTEPTLSTTYVGHMLFNIVFAKDFNGQDLDILKMVLAKVGTEASMRCSHPSFQGVQSLLMVAVQERANTEAIKLLLQHRFAPDQQPAFVKDVDYTRSTALHYWASNQWSLVTNDSNVVGGSYMNAEKSFLDDEFADRELGARPEMPVFNLLFAAWPECVSLRDAQDLSFVDLLVTSNCSLSVWEEVLLRVPEALSWKKKNGDSLLHLACTHAHIPSMCRKGVVSADSSQFSRTRFSTSINYERCEIVAWLLRKVPDAAAVANAKGQLPLHYAAQYHCDPVIVGLLVEAFPDALSHADVAGNMPLHLAVKWSGSLFSSHTEVVNIMVFNQKNLSAQNRFGKGFLACSMPETLSREDNDKLVRINLDSPEERILRMDVGYYSVESALNNCTHRKPRLDLYLLLIKLNTGALDEPQRDGRDIFHNMRDLFLKSMLTPFFRHAYVNYVLFCAACVAQLGDCKSSAHREVLMCKSMLGCLHDAKYAMRQEVNNVTSTIQSDFAENIDNLKKQVAVLEERVMAREMKGKDAIARLRATELLLEEENKNKSIGAKMAKDSERRRREKERKKNEKNEAAEAVRLLEEARLSAESVARSLRVQEGIRLRKIRAEKDLEEREQREAEEAVERHEQAEETLLCERITAEKRQAAEDAETRARQGREGDDALLQRNLDLDAKLHLRVQEDEEETKRADDAALAAQTAAKKKKKPKKVVKLEATDAKTAAPSVSAVLPSNIEWNPVLHIAMGVVPPAAGASESDIKHKEEMQALRKKIELEMQIDKECVVCLDSIRCMALGPCGHIAVCQNCADALMLETPKLCPTCRNPVSSTLRVY